MTVEPLVQPIPITIISGFLGAGKTTLLNNILHADHGLKVAVLVNDFGEVNIDAQLIVGVEGETISLSNGCICCNIRGDLVDAVVRLVNREDRPEYIIVETSGVSDPIAVAMTFRMPELAYFVQLDAILTVVDAENFLTLEEQDSALAAQQLEMADLVILNKVDVVTPAYLAGVRQKIEQVSPRARILETSFARVPMEFIVGLGSFAPERLAQRQALDVHVHGAHDHEHDHGHGHDHSLVYSTWNWSSAQPVALEAFRGFVNRLPKTLYRAKGVIYLADIPEHMAIFHLVGKRAALTLAGQWEGTAPHSQIVFIGAHGGLPVDDLRTWLAECLATTPAPGIGADYKESWQRG